jgi:hypothetical protein
MSLDREAREFNERQKRYQEQEWQHKHMGGKDHREMMEVLNNMERSLGYLIDTFNRWVEAWEKQWEENQRRSSYGLYDPQKYRTQRGGHDRDVIEGDAFDMPEDLPPYRNPYKNRGPFDKGTHDGGAGFRKGDPHLQ